MLYGSSKHGHISLRTIIKTVSPLTSPEQSLNLGIPHVLMDKYKFSKSLIFFESLTCVIANKCSQLFSFKQQAHFVHFEKMSLNNLSLNNHS